MVRVTKAQAQKLVGRHIYAVRKDRSVVYGKLVGIKGDSLILERGNKGKQVQTKAIIPLVLFDLLAIGTAPYAYWGGAAGGAAGAAVGEAGGKTGLSSTLSAAVPVPFKLVIRSIAKHNGRKRRCIRFFPFFMDRSNLFWILRHFARCTYSL
ncbi:hypothetical protein [Cohnella rhizosphaerae]|uniref:hypothetical protein n=1 Tax=Cohnella rhizosphaerae TaxID=1457232 RepID=UPI0030B9130C